jgi:hypothetical protein
LEAITLAGPDYCYLYLALRAEDYIAAECQATGNQRTWRSKLRSLSAQPTSL